MKILKVALVWAALFAGLGLLGGIAYRLIQLGWALAMIGS